MAELYNTDLFNDANLVAYYRLNDNFDSKSTNHFTTVNGSPTWVSGKYFNAVSLGESNTNNYLFVFVHLIALFEYH